MDYPKSVPGVGLVGGKFVDENPATGQQGSLIPSGWGNQVTDELLAVIAAAGLEPSEEQSDQVLQALLEMQTKLSADSGMVVLIQPGVHVWEVPEVLRSGKKKAFVRGCGGGGSGARQTTASGGVAYGGGGAGSFEVIVDLEGVSSVTSTIGAGGVFTAGTTASIGVSGGTTSFGGYASGTGGSGGALSGVGVPGGKGVSSISGALLHTGSSGAVSYLSSDGATRFGGGGGGSIFGPGGMANSDGWAFGAGGGAAFGTSSVVGSGVGGVIQVIW